MEVFSVNVQILVVSTIEIGKVGLFNIEVDAQTPSKITLISYGL